MANDAYTQQALAEDVTFINRVKNAMVAKAWAVLVETPQPANYTARAAYARLVLTDPTAYARTFAQWLVTRGNVMGFNTSYDFQKRAVVTASGDADIESQIFSDWNFLAGA